MANNDSNQHIVKTSAQWNGCSVEYWVVPRGCLCIELTPNGKTKLKVGEGNKIYSQLPYISDSDLSSYYTKEEVDNIISNIQYMSIKSTDEYESKNNLPVNGNSVGDVRFVKSQSPSIKKDPDTYVWNGMKWVLIGSPLQDIDLSEYVKKKDFNIIKDKVEEMYPNMHTHDNKNVLDKIEEPFTTKDKKKLDTLENYDDTNLKNLINNNIHTHPNKDILDKIEAPFTIKDKNKINSLTNYDDTAIDNRLSKVEDAVHQHTNKNALDKITLNRIDKYDEVVTYSFEIREHLNILDNEISFLKTCIHEHTNKEVLDNTTASYTIKDRKLLYQLSNITIFNGAGDNYPGTWGYVPQPIAGQQNSFLRGDGTWVDIENINEYKPGIGIKFEYHDQENNDEDIENLQGVYIVNTGILDVNNKDDEVGVITVTTVDGDKAVDLLENLNKLILNCNNEPD